MMVTGVSSPASRIFTQSGITTGRVTYYLGFDPGGDKAFGWALAVQEAGTALTLMATGCAQNATLAVGQALESVPNGAAVAAAGIDAPLFWTPDGKRTVDATIRRVLRARGAPSPGGTVQQLNSLRGACLVQGIAAAMLLRRHDSRILLTETHPKALLWCLGVARRGYAPSAVSTRDLNTLISLSTTPRSEHERDAAISCVAAFALHLRKPGWHDLALTEHGALHLIPGGVSYWMPEGDAAGECPSPS